MTASLCAVSRTIVSLAQPGRTQKEVLGSPTLPRPERERGQEHGVESSGGPKACKPRCCKTRVLWRERHCPKPNSQGSICPPIGTTSIADVRSNHGIEGRSGFLLRVGPMINEIIEGNEWAAYGTLGRTLVTEHGMAYSPRGPRSRSAHSSRGSHVPPGRSVTPATGQRGTGICGNAAEEGGEMPTAEPAALPSASAGRQILESVLPRKRHGAFGEGPTEKDWATSTSPAAYSTFLGR